MKTIEELRDLSKNPIVNNACLHSSIGLIIEESFINGYKYALDNQWHKIERDNNGIAAEECLDEIFENDSVLIHSNRNDTLQLLSEDFDYWRGDIKRQCRFDYWMVMPKIR